MPGVDRDLLASYTRAKMAQENLSIRRAADMIGCSAATLSRLLGGSDSEYVPDTATVTAIATWLDLNVSDFDPERKPERGSIKITELEMHMHALENLTEEDATEMFAVVKALYDFKLKRNAKDK